MARGIMESMPWSSGVSLVGVGLAIILWILQVYDWKPSPMLASILMAIAVCTMLVWPLTLGLSWFYKHMGAEQRILAAFIVIAIGALVGSSTAGITWWFLKPPPPVVTLPSTPPSAPPSPQRGPAIRLSGKSENVRISDNVVLGRDLLDAKDTKELDVRGNIVSPGRPMLPEIARVEKTATQLQEIKARAKVLSSELLQFVSERQRGDPPLPWRESWAQDTEAHIRYSKDTMTQYSEKFGARVIAIHRELAESGLTDSQLDARYQYATNPLGITLIGERIGALAERIHE